MTFSLRLVPYLCLLFVGIIFVQTHVTSLVVRAPHEESGIRAEGLHTPEPPFDGRPLRARQNAGTATVNAVDWPIRAY